MPRTPYRHRLVRALFTLAFAFALTSCGAGGDEGAHQPGPDVATFGTALFDDAQFE